MTAYVIAQLTFTRRETYDRYQARFRDAFVHYGGRLLAADEHPKILEGTWERNKVVLMSFADEAAYLEWSQSAEYQEISRDRKTDADAVVLLVRAL